MAAEELLRQRAKEAREKAAADKSSRQTWLEIAKSFEQLADQPGKTRSTVTMRHSDL